MQTSFFKKLMVPFRFLRFFIGVFLAYLIHVSVMPYFAVNGVTANMLFITGAVVAVSYGRLRSLWCGCIFGCFMETMLPGLKYFNLAAYTILIIAGGVIFADKTEKRIEIERSTGKEKPDMHPYIRIPLCTMLMTLVYEAVNLAYIYLVTDALIPSHYSSAAASIFYTTALSVVLMIPLRRLFGFSAPKRPEKKPRGHYAV